MKNAAHTTNRFRMIALAGLMVIAGLSGGCLQRTITVSTNPPGAVVWLNDQEMGRTPVEVDFTYFGKYSVRIRKEGYEPIVTIKEARAPIQEQPGVDLVAEALPMNIETNLQWHWDLTPTLEAQIPAEQAEEKIIAEAMELRKRTVIAGTESKATDTPKEMEKASDSDSSKPEPDSLPDAPKEDQPEENNQPEENK